MKCDTIMKMKISNEVQLNLVEIDKTKQQSVQLTSEQNRVVQTVLKAKQNVVVQAVAGSGKSKTLIQIAIAAAQTNPHFKMLILVYNQKLQQENQDLINHLVQQQVLPLGALVVKTYHSFINMQGGIKQALLTNDFLKDPEAKQQNPDLWYYLDWMEKHNQFTRNDAGLWDWTNAYLKALENPDFLAKWAIYFQHYDVVAFDEAQDLKPAYWQVAKIIIKIQNYQTVAYKMTKTNFVLVGDPMQTIYQHEGADQRYLTLIKQTLPKLDWVELSLSKSFRTSHKIAQVIQVFNPNHPFNAAITTNEDEAPVVINICDPVVVNQNHQGQKATDAQLSQIFSAYKGYKNTPNQDLVKIKNQLQHQLMIRYPVAFKIAKAINDKIKVENYQPKDIAVLSYLNVDKQQQAPMRIFLDVIRQILYGYFEILCGLDAKSSNQVHFETFHKAKGREWKAVFVIGCADREVAFSESKYLKHKDDLPNTHYVAFSRAQEFLSINIVNVVSDQNQVWKLAKQNVLAPYMAKQWANLLDLENHNVVQLNIGSTWANRQQVFKKVNFWFQDGCFHLKTGVNAININDPNLITGLKSLWIKQEQLVQTPFKTKVPTYVEGIYHQMDGHDKFKISDLLPFAMLANAQLINYQLHHLAKDYHGWNQILMKLYNISASGLKNLQSNLDFQILVDFINDQQVVNQAQVILKHLVNNDDLIWAAKWNYWEPLIGLYPNLSSLKQLPIKTGHFGAKSEILISLKKGIQIPEWRLDLKQSYGFWWDQLIKQIKVVSPESQFLSIDCDFEIDYLHQDYLLTISDFMTNQQQLLERSIATIYLMLLHNELYDWALNALNVDPLAALILEQQPSRFAIKDCFKIVDLTSSIVSTYRLDQTLIAKLGTAWMINLINNQMQISDQDFIATNLDLKTNFKIKLD